MYLASGFQHLVTSLWPHAFQHLKLVSSLVTYNSHFVYRYVASYFILFHICCGHLVFAFWHPLLFQNAHDYKNDECTKTVCKIQQLYNQMPHSMKRL